MRAIVITCRPVKIVSYMVKGTGLRKERPCGTTNLLCVLNKSFTFTWVIRKMGIMRILTINQGHKMYLLKSFEKLCKCKDF